MKAILLAFSLFIHLSCESTPVQTESRPTQIILVRHAEKKAGKNPDLTTKGQKRAQALSQISEKYPISAVLSSNYKRTLQTATPLAQKLNLKIHTELAPKDYAQMLGFIKKNYSGKTVLIAGHSNTVPQFINYVLKEEKLKKINKEDFAKLFIVTLKDPIELKVYEQKLLSDGKLELIEK